MRNQRFLSTLVALLLSFPALAATVEGYVYRADGTPLDATVTAYAVESSAAQAQRLASRTPRPALASTKTEGGGKFAFAQLPDSVIDVDVRAEGYAPRVVRTIANDAPLSITMRVAAMVEGRVTANGKPVADAYVVWIGQFEVEHAATTDNSGRYRVPDPNKWAGEPRVFHPTFALPPPPHHRGPEALHIELQPRGKETPPARGGGSISGTVRVGKKPLAGAPVLIHAMVDELSRPIRVVSDAKGRYAIDGLPARRTLVRIGDGFHPRFRAPYDVDVVAVDGAGPGVAQLDKERIAVVDLELTPSPLISGRVTDVDGKPVAGAEINVVLAGRSMHDFVHEPSVRTSSDGRYSIPAPQFGGTESAQIAVGARNRSVVRSRPFQIGDESMTVDVALPRFENVTLRVVGTNGNAVPNAQVAFASSDDMLMFRDVGMLVSPMVEGRSIRADANGTLALQLVPGTYDVAATAKGFQTRSMAGVQIARGSNVEIALEPAFAIRGRVHRNGVGVAGANVMLSAGERSRRQHQPVFTGADGAFEIDGLARGKYRVVVMKQDELLNKTVDAEAPSTIDVALPPAGRLRGRVLDAATREPVGQFVYAIEPLDVPEERPVLERTAPMHRGESRVDGTFAVTLPVGRYRLTARAVGYTQSEVAEVRVTEREAAPVDLLLGRGVTISGRVTDEAGSPLANATVYAMGAENERTETTNTLRVGPGNTTTGDDGAFTIRGLEPGNVLVIARKEGFVPVRRTLEATGATSLDLQLTRGLTIEGVVTRGGKPVADVQIGATTPALGGDHQPAMSDANGRFVLRGLIAARYSISAYKEQLHAEVRDVDPTRQRELVITLDPKPAGIIFGTVTGIPANLAGKIARRVVFAQSEERGSEAMIDDAGNYRMEDAPTGSVFISAQVESPAGGRSSARKRVDVVAGQPLRVDLDLAGSLTVRGRVSLEGKPIGGARVLFSIDNGPASSTMTREDGAYELTLPTAGTYQIFAHSETLATRPAQLVREVRGGETIDIDLREQMIEGVIVDAETRLPIAGAFVTIAPEAAPLSATTNALPPQIITGESVTDANGRFRLLVATSGAHRIVAWARGYAHRTQPLQLGGSRTQQIAFDLTKTGELRVRVLDAKTGIPLEAHVVVEGVPVRADRAPDGTTFTFSLAEGKYRVTAVVHGYATKTVEATAPGSIDIGL